MARPRKTSKKVKFVGTEKYINARTGEVQEMVVSEIEERDFNFSKVWMRNFIATLDLVGNKKTKVCYWIIDNINSENMLIGTLRQIADKTNTSLETVRITMDVLLQADFLRRKSQGVFMLNPDSVFKGRRDKRLNILNQYYDCPKTEITDEMKLRNLMNTIKELTEQAEALKEKLNREAPLPGQVGFYDSQTVDKPQKNAV